MDRQKTKRQHTKGQTHPFQINFFKFEQQKLLREVSGIFGFISKKYARQESLTIR